MVLTSAEGIKFPAYVLIPDRLRGKTPAVVAVHGHGYGKDDIVGILEDGTQKAGPDGYQKDFALEIVRRGLLVIAPEVLGFGERREEKEKKQAANLNSCKDASLFALEMGRTMIGLRVWDVMRCVDYLGTRLEVDSRRIGIMGISGGGMVSLFSAALEGRITAAVVSGYLNTFQDSILAIDHCLCNYMPGILRYGEMYDVASLIAPRPLLIESSTRDEYFPFKASVYSFGQVQKAYRVAGAEANLEKDFFRGRHQISGARAYDFLVEKLS